MSEKWQTDAERDYDYLGKRVVVRIKFRKPGTRRWSKFLVIPDDAHSVGYVMMHAEQYVAAFLAGRDAA